MDLLIVMIILLAFLLQNDSLDLKGRIREFFQPKETGGMRPDADYGNIHPEGTAKEKERGQRGQKSEKIGGKNRQDCGSCSGSGSDRSLCTGLILYAE